jgi:hypothetical protein
MTRLDDETAKGILLSRFMTFMETRKVDLELMLSVFQHGAKEAPEGPAFLKEFVETTDNPDWKAKALLAIGCSPPDEFARIAAPWLINGPVHYLSSLISGAMWRWENSKWLWDFGRLNIDTLIEKYGTMSFLLPSYFEAAASVLVGSEQIRQAEEFAASHDEAIFHRALVNTIKKVKARPQAAQMSFNTQVVLDYIGPEENRVEETQ